MQYRANSQLFSKFFRQSATQRLQIRRRFSRAYNGRFFSHANGFHGRCFDPVIESLVADYECVSFDLRGHGDSTVSPDWSVAWQGYGDDALAIAKRISKPTISVGHSMGGAALVMAALVEPKLFRALILYEPIIFPDSFREIALNSPGPSPLVEGARRRRRTFATRADAFANYASKPPMNAFDPRALHAFVNHGFKDISDFVELKCAPEHEARNFEMGAIHQTWDQLKICESQLGSSVAHSSQASHRGWPRTSLNKSLIRVSLNGQIWVTSDQCNNLSGSPTWCAKLMVSLHRTPSA